MTEENPWWLKIIPTTRDPHPSPRLAEWFKEAETEDLIKALDNKSLRPYAHKELWLRFKVVYR